MIDFKAAVKIGEKEKQIQIGERDGLQWLMLQAAAFPMVGMPKFTEGSFRATFGLDEKIPIEFRKLGSGYENIEEKMSLPATETAVQLVSGMKSISAGRGIKLYPSRYFKVIKDKEMATAIFGEADTSRIAIKTGMFVEAVIYAVPGILTNEFLDGLQDYIDQCRAAIEEE